MFYYMYQIKNKINGNIKRPIQAVNTISTAVSLFSKYRSTRYLSKWVDNAHNIGPENAKIIHITKLYHLIYTKNSV